MMIPPIPAHSVGLCLAHPVSQVQHFRERMAKLEQLGGSCQVYFCEKATNIFYWVVTQEHDVLG